MNKLLNHIQLLMGLLACLFISTEAAASAAGTVSEEELVEKYHRYRALYSNGTEEEFYAFAAEYLDFLSENKQKEAFYKIKCNVGFFDMAHHHIYRAMQTATELDKVVKADNATEFYYLSTGLLGDIYKECHNVKRARELYMQAISEAGDRDPKYCMMKYMEMAEMLVLSKPDEALQWANRSVQQARESVNIEFLSQSLGMLGYVCFMNGNKVEFDKTYSEYADLKAEDSSKFNARFDNFMTTAHLAFSGRYDEAEQMCKAGDLHVDEILVSARINSLIGDAKKTFNSVASYMSKLDSVYSEGQNADLDEVSNRVELMRMRQEADEKSKLLGRIEKIFIAVTILYLFIYVMGRRRLVKKIWAKNDKLKAALEKVEESDKLRTAFIRNMGYEVRTPLNAINGFSQLLCSPDYELTESEKLDMKERITENVEVVTTIVNELLEMSRGETEIPKGDVQVNNLCRNAVNSAKARNHKNITIDFTTEVDDNFTFSTNQESLSRMLYHLLGNAVKFTREGSVNLNCSRNGQEISFAVTDTGIGVPADARERIFENFVKLSDYTGGVGLGLPVCRRLARQLGGDVVIDADYTDGARFVLALPLK